MDPILCELTADLLFCTLIKAMGEAASNVEKDDSCITDEVQHECMF